MKRIITINISSTPFFIDDDAYLRLSEYLNFLKARFAGEAGGDEIIADIETRISEHFAQRINPKTGVITIAMVDEVIQIMGQPDDFSDSSSEKDENTQPDASAATTVRHRLYRDVENQIIGGVCAGIAAYIGIAPIFVRIITVVLTFFSFGTVLPVYIVLWIAMPAALTTTQKMEMRGETVTVSNIEKRVKEEYEDAKNRFNHFKQTNKTYRKSEDFVKKMSRRDQTVLIITGAVVLLLLFAQLTAHPPFNIHFTGNYLPTPFFNGFFPLVILLLVLGLVFRSAFKGFVIIILILATLSVFIKMTGWIFSHTIFM